MSTPSQAMSGAAVLGGFSEAPVEAANAFRAVLAALSRPGTLHSVTGAQPPAPMSPAAGAVALTLCDATTPVHLAGALDTQALRDWMTFHTNAPLVDAEDAMFAFGTWEALQPLGCFALGTPEYPDRAVTLVVELEALAAAGATLKGPGIETTAQLSLPETQEFIQNRARFPLGFDTLFTCGAELAGLPRSTIVEAN